MTICFRPLPLAVAFVWLLALPEESRAWTTRVPPQQRPVRKSHAVTRLALSHQEEEDCRSSEALEGSASSRRRWLASTLASAVAVGGLIPPLPSHAAATLVSAKSVCDPTVSVWSKNGRIIYLLGTAHISSQSAELAGRLVRDTNPKGVFIELDPKRVSGDGAIAQKFQATDGSGKESKIIVPKISAVPGDGGLVLASSSEEPSSGASAAASTATAGEAASSSAALPAAKPAAPPPKKDNNNPLMKAATVAVGKQLKGLYQRMDEAGFDSGSEFVTAVQEGRKLGADIVLGDRDVEVTLRRVTEGLSKTDLKAFLSPDSELEKTLEEMVPVNPQVQERLVGSNGPKSEQQLTDAEFKQEMTTFVETMKTKENVKKIMGQLQRVAPFLYEALVSERDVYMATGLNGLNELETIVAVVGIAHADGIETTLQGNGWKAANPACRI